MSGMAIRTAPEVTTALATIATRVGHLTPALVLDAARDPASPLHSCFEWDDGRAGEKYRLLQAAKLCAAQRAFKVVTSGENEVSLVDHANVRRFLSSRSDDGVYLEREKALADPDVRARQVRAFRAELRSWAKRTVDIAELATERAAIAALVPDE